MVVSGLQHGCHSISNAVDMERTNTDTALHKKEKQVIGHPIVRI